MVVKQERIERLIQRLKDNDATLTEFDLRNIDGSRSYTFLSNSPVLEEFIAALRVNRTVTNVNLILRFLTNLSPPEKFALAETIGRLPNLHHLRIGSSGLAGLPLRIASTILRHAKGSLKKLTLQSIPFKGKFFYKTPNGFNTKDPEYAEFLEVLQEDYQGTLESFVLQDVEDSFDLDPLAQVLASFSNLQEVRLQSHTQFQQRLSKTSVEQLMSSRSLKSLSLKRLRLVDRTVTNVNLILRFLTNLSPPEKFALAETIGRLPNLHHLRIGSSGLAGLPLRIASTILRHAKGSLKKLTLQSIPFKGKFFYKTPNGFNTKDPEYAEFLEVLQEDYQGTLESFVLQDVEDSFDLDPLAQVLASFSNLQEVRLQSHTQFQQRLSKTSVEQLMSSRSLKSLSLKRLRLVLVLQESLVALEDNTTLERLSLEQNGMNYEGGMALAYLLGTNRTLREIRVGFNQIPDDCGSAIITAVAHNPTLKVLDLSSNELDVYTCRRVAHMLVANESALEDLNLSLNGLRDEGVSMIAGGLGENTTLRSLSLARNQISTASWVLAASLHTNQTLQRLNLADNRIQNEGCKSLAAALKINHCLTSLNLFGNELKDDSVLELNEMLRTNSTLDRVNLGNNPDLTPKAYKALQDMLMKDNHTLQHLWLPMTIDIVMPDNHISSYLNLNKIGRKQLLQELDNARIWVDAMYQASSDIHILYYLIRAIPAVVSWLPMPSMGPPTPILSSDEPFTRTIRES